MDASSFMWGLNTGLLIGFVMLICQYERWRRFCNELLAKLYDLRKTIRDQDGTSDL